MKLFSIQIILCLVLLGFVSCSEDDKTESSFINTEGAATRNIPEFFPAGTTIELNPTITFTSELKIEKGSTASAEYSNADNWSAFPVPVPAGSQTVTVTLSEDFNDEVILSFVVNGDKKVEIALLEFTDLGIDGFYDEFKVRADVIDQSNNNSVSNISISNIGASDETSGNLRVWHGRFTGSIKPRNQSVTNLIDVRRAPTEEEFYKLIVGKSLYYHIDVVNEIGFISFEDSGMGSLRYYQNSGHTDANKTGHTHQIRWLYKYLDGNPELEIKTKEDDEHYRKFELTFTDFYEGTLTEVEGYDFDNNDPFTTNQTGSFKFYKGIVFTWNHDYNRP